MEHFYICILNEYTRNIFGSHYPKEIIMLIVMIFYRGMRISCGAYYNVLLHTDKIYVWGDNENGQLGLGPGDVQIRISPTEIILDKNIESIVCGWDFTIAHVSNSKELWVWGCNKSNELGLMHIADKIYSPTKMYFKC